MYPYRNNSYNMNSNSSNYQNYVYSNNDERFFIPFVVGGLAGTALGYGIANNNQINNMNKPYYYSYYPAYPIVYYPNSFTNYNNFY